MRNFNLKPILQIPNAITLMARTAVGRQCRLGHLPAPAPCTKMSVFLSFSKQMRLFFSFFTFFPLGEGIESEAAEGKDAVMLVSKHNNDRCRIWGWSTGMHMPGIDGIDRAIKFCSADILLPAPRLMRCLMDGLPWTRLVEARSFLFSPSVIHLPSFTYHSACAGEQDYVGIVISWRFRVSSKAIAAHLHVLNLKKVHFLAVNEGWARCAGGIADSGKEYLPPNWYDVWHFICRSWPPGLIMLPKAIGAEERRHNTQPWMDCKDTRTRTPHKHTRPCSVTDLP